MFGHGEDVLVAAATEIHHDDLVAIHRRGEFRDVSQSVRGLERRDDTFGPGAELESRQRFLIGGGDVFDPPDLVQPGMLRPDAGIIRSGTD